MGQIAHFGTLGDGRETDLVTLEKAGARAEIVTFGARLKHLSFDDGPNLTIGSDHIAEYQREMVYFGPIIAPVVNRIAGAAAEIDGVPFRFEANQDARHCLHSGRAGSQNSIWRIAEIGPDRVVLSLTLGDGHGGFPGNREINVSYELADAATLRLVIEASTDAHTFMNPAHHGYWNLDGTTHWAGHRLQVEAPRYLPTDADGIPTGEIGDLDGTHFDLRRPAPPSPETDHNYCLARSGGPLRRAARLIGATGTVMDLMTTAPGLQVYCGATRGIALEPQLWPDAPHHPGFPSIMLGPDDRFLQETRYVFANRGPRPNRIDVC